MIDECTHYVEGGYIATLQTLLTNLEAQTGQDAQFLKSASQRLHTVTQLYNAIEEPH